MLQGPARPDRGCLGIERQPDPPSFEILRCADAAAPIDENVAVPEYPRRKDRNGDERTIAGAVEAGIFRGGKLGDVEFPAPHHAVEDVTARFERDAVEVDAFDRDIAVADGFQPVVPATGEGQGKTGHHSGSMARRGAAKKGRMQRPRRSNRARMQRSKAVETFSA